MGVIGRVIAGEGVRSAMRRTRGRIAEFAHQRWLLARGRFLTKLPRFPILNILSTPLTPRLGGIQVHLLARLRAERASRPVALLTPGLLTLSQPYMHARRVRLRLASGALYDDAFVDVVREAAAIAGARVLHFEGMFGIPTGSVLQLIEEGFEVVLSLHDFSLVSGDAYLDPSASTERRTLGNTLLQHARAVVYPSRFLERELGLLGRIIPAAPPPAHVVRDRKSSRPRIAFAGAVTARKGALLLRPIVESLAGRGIEWFVFGGGDVDVLRSLRKLRDVHVHGQYAMGTLPSLLARNAIDVVLLLSTEPEIYSLTLSESWMAGVPVIAFAHGAIDERVRDHDGGWLVPLEEGSAGIVAMIEHWLDGATLPRVPSHVETADDAARAYLSLYDMMGAT